MEDCDKGKPDPAGIKMAMARLGSDAVYVGDTVDDVKAAKNAGIKAVGVLPPNVASTRLKEVLEQNRASTVLQNINAITEVLE